MEWMRTLYTEKGDKRTREIEKDDKLIVPTVQPHWVLSPLTVN
jgi:hypothetical protein